MRVFVWVISISCLLEALAWLSSVNRGEVVERSVAQQAFNAAANAALAAVGFALLFK